MKWLADGPPASRRLSRRRPAAGSGTLPVQPAWTPSVRWVVLLFLLFTTTLHATTTSAITGRVTSGGAPAAGVTVTVTSKSLLGERTTVTTASGRYWLTALPPGRYDVTFSRAKLQTLTRRVLVELSRVARADAVLEPSDDEESITATAIPITVADTTVVTAHFSDELLDRLPLRRDPYNAYYLSPGPLGGFTGFVNDATTFTAQEGGMESLEQVTLLRSALPADYDRSPVFTARTRGGGEDYFFSLRDTITNRDWIAMEFPGLPPDEGGIQQVVEVNAGGPVIDQKLWFFAGAWNGSEVFLGDRTGAEGKLTWQPGASHNLGAFYTTGETSTAFYNPESTVASLRYTGTPSARVTTEAVLSRTTSSTRLDEQPPIGRYRYDSLFAKTTYVLGTRAGDHILSAGGRTSRDRLVDASWFFVNDRWVVNRMTFNLGMRHEEDRFSPRLAAAFDVRGNGRQAISASFSEYLSPIGPMREQTLGFATAVGTTGTIRVDGIRHDYESMEQYGALADFRYSLFDRFHTGASYTWFRTSPRDFDIQPEHTAHAWAGVDIPAGEHEFGVTVLQHYTSRIAELLEERFSTDLALRYSLPVSRVRLTVAADVVNVFDHDKFTGRTVRGWLRLRL